MGIFGKLFNKQKVLDPIDLSRIGVDVHSHLIPGIDDGSPDMTTSLNLLRGFQDLGYRKVITTPHVMSDYYRNTSSIITDGLEKVQAACRQDGLNIEVEAAAEYYLDEHFDQLIEADDLLTLGNRFVLFELPFVAAPDMLKSTLFKLQMAGYKPVLAHAERYAYWHREPQKFRDLFDRDVYIQLNINSLTGFYSEAVRKAAEWMIDQQLVTFAASDCHHAGHLNLLNDARSLPYLHKLVDSGRLLNEKF